LKIHYNPILKQRARELRRNTTLSEKILWKYLRSRQLYGYQFQRQKPIDQYIVDFYCSKLKLVIEVDGITHNEKQKYDTNREKQLHELGLTVLRFNGYYILENATGVLEIISKKILELEKITTP
jgi:very-short-patch-repair endonuclease